MPNKYILIFMQGDNVLRKVTKEEGGPPTLWRGDDGVFWIRWGVQDGEAFYYTISEAYEKQKEARGE